VQKPLPAGLHGAGEGRLDLIAQRAVGR
jgi:hypothetical protein